MSRVIYNIKKFLKKSEKLRKLNAVIGAATLEFQHDQLFKNVTPSLTSLNDEALDSLRSKVKKKISNANKPRIIWVGANYQQDYSGFIQALSIIGDVTVFTRDDGTYGLEAPRIREKLIFDDERKKNSDRLYSIFLESGGSNGVDIVIGQMWSTLIDPQVLEKIRSTGVVVLNVAMDDKLPVHWKSDSSDRLAGSIGLAENVDLTLNTSKQAVTLYAVRGCACVYWPLASDGGVFSPIETKLHDVVFIGSNYGFRSKIISELIAAGIDVKAFGPGFPSGLLSPEESAKIFGEAKIVLGIGFVGYSQRISTLKLRDFDALFTGALYITSRNEDLEEIFTEDENIVFYDSTNELIEKVKYYLANEEQRQLVAKNALEEARANHLWEKRLRDTFLMLGIE